MVSPTNPITEAREITCQSCDGTGWVDDQNWSPAFPDAWPPDEREPGNGKIQCWTCVGTGTVERDQSEVIAELKALAETQAAEIERLKAQVEELNAEAKEVEESHADDRRMIDRIADIIGLPHDQELDTTAFELWSSDQTAERDSLKAALAKAEDQLKIVRQCTPAPLTVEELRTDIAAQFTKEREGL